MDKLLIEGGRAIHGQMPAPGSKNACLPILAASLLSDEPQLISHVPGLTDVACMFEIFSFLGASFTAMGSDRFEISAADMNSHKVPNYLARRMRASILLLAPLLVRFGKVYLPLPGGCVIGQRPIDWHIQALSQLGVEFTVDEEGIEARVTSAGLQAADIIFEHPTVTGSENAIMACAAAKGRSTISGVVLEPEVIELCHYLNTMGANIQGIGTNQLVIEGVNTFNQSSWSIGADRIASSTFLVAAAATRGYLRITSIHHDILQDLIGPLKQLGVSVGYDEQSVWVDARSASLRAVDVITSPFPGFATDLQAPWMALSTQCQGQTVITEQVYVNRYKHIVELRRMGAKIDLKDNQAFVYGPEPLVGTEVQASDIRAGAGLIIAALVAEGTTTICGMEHIDRGYESIEEQLKHIGIKAIRRTSQKVT